jgi:hypothetical protein
VSGSFCLLARDNDINAGLRDPHNHHAYIRLCTLEVLSSFSYRSTKWLCDEAPELLPEEIRNLIPEAKRRAAKRRLIEKRIPKELLFENHGGRKAWPKFQPSLEQCALIASVRCEMAELMELQLNCTTAQEVFDRYAELLKEKAARQQRAALKTEKSENKKRCVTVKKKGKRARKIEVDSFVAKESVTEAPIPPPIVIDTTNLVQQQRLFL